MYLPLVQLYIVNSCFPYSLCWEKRVIYERLLGNCCRILYSAFTNLWLFTENLTSSIHRSNFQKNISTKWYVPIFSHGIQQRQWKIYPRRFYDIFDNLWSSLGILTFILKSYWYLELSVPISFFVWKRLHLLLIMI